MNIKALSVMTILLSPVFQATAESAYFMCRNSETSCLKLEVGYNNTTIAVPLFREASNSFSRNTLQCGDAVVTVDWNLGQSDQVVLISIPKGRRVGETIPLQLYDGDVLCEESQIYIVPKQKNGVYNPYWLGERTADSLKYGEWTFDYDVALEKIRTDSQGGSILAVFSGQLWCPSCKKFEEAVLTQSRFTKWAKDNRVVIVLFDQPRFGYSSPQLLSYENNSNWTDETAVSGASYMSRKNVLSGDAREVIARTTQLSYVTWLPEGTSAKRLSNPTLLLIDRDGNVASRFKAYTDGSGNYTLNENIGRLNDLLAGSGNGPVLTLDREVVDLYSFIETENFIGVTPANIQGGSQKLKKLAGTLPLGVSVDLDFDANRIVVSGTPRNEGSHTATFALTEKRNGKVVVGDSFDIEFVVSLPAGLSGLGGNGSKWTIPLMGVNPNNGAQDIVGTMDFSISKANKLAAKVHAQDFKGTFTGYWNVYDNRTGSLYARLEKNKTAVEVELKASGELIAIVENNGAVELSGAEGVYLRSSGGHSFVGQYNVAVSSASAINTTAKSLGIGYIVLTVNSSSRAKWKCTLADGKTISGNSLLAYDKDGNAIVSIYKKASVNTLFAALRVASKDSLSNAANDYACVTAFNDEHLRWIRKEKKNTIERYHDVYGSFFSKDFDLSALAMQTYGTAELSLWFDSKNHVSDGGAVTNVCSGRLVVEASDMKLKDGLDVSLRYDRKTGMVKGKTKILFDGKKSKGANFTGVLIPGWKTMYGTPSPLCVGTLVFTDRMNGVSTRVSFPMFIEAIE